MQNAWKKEKKNASAYEDEKDPGTLSNVLSLDYIYLR